MEIPKAFISYSHDSQEHKKWVLELAIRLRNHGIDAILDQFELQAGDDIPHFMETNLATADKILMICTEKYVDKANKGEGGVGYEKMIITSNLMKKINENKIIPVIRQAGTSDVPTFLKTKLYINFSRKDDYEFSYDELVRTIHNSPLFKKSPVGNNPFKPVEEERLDGDFDLLHAVIKAIDQEYSNFDHPYNGNIAQRLGISRTLVDVVITKLIKLGYARWTNGDQNSVDLTNEGKLYAYENKLLINQ